MAATPHDSHVTSQEEEDGEGKEEVDTGEVTRKPPESQLDQRLQVSVCLHTCKSVLSMCISGLQTCMYSIWCPL